MSDLQCPARLLVLRHAEPAGPDRLEDALPLGAAGLGQAEALAATLTEQHVVHVYTSPTGPALATAAVLAARLGAGTTTDLGLGPRLPTEDEPAVLDRVTRALADIADMHRGEAAAVVTQEGVMQLMLTRVAGTGSGVLPGGPPREFAPCDLVELEVDADGWVARSWRASVQPMV